VTSRTAGLPPKIPPMSRLSRRSVPRKASVTPDRCEGWHSLALVGTIFTDPHYRSPRGETTSDPVPRHVGPVSMARSIGVKSLDWNDPTGQISLMTGHRPSREAKCTASIIRMPRLCKNMNATDANRGRWSPELLAAVADAKIRKKFIFARTGWTSAGPPAPYAPTPGLPHVLPRLPAWMKIEQESDRLDLIAIEVFGGLAASGFGWGERIRRGP
jgi:hypothetical protein